MGFGSTAREEPYAAFVAGYRDRLIGTAALVHLDPERAPALVDAALVQTYAAWPRLDDSYGQTLRAVLDPAGTPPVAPPATTGAAADGFELVDVAHPDTPADRNFPEDVRSELARLSVDERRILVLASYTRHPVREIARLLRRDPEDVAAQLTAAHRALLAMPRRHGPRRLEAELAVAARTPQPDPVDTGRAGRSVVRLRRLRLVALVTIVLVLAAFGIRQLLPSDTSVASEAPADPPTTAPPPPCDTTLPECRSAIVTGWRLQMAAIVSEYLDPDGRYFTAVSYAPTDGRVDPGYWRGGSGVFTTELYRPGDGATAVSLEIATSRQVATPCGRVTRRPCQSQKFMDGNRFLLTDPYDVAHGLEVQQRPAGTYVVSLVARNTSKTGRELDVDRGDLMRLILDPRLQLPPR